MSIFTNWLGKEYRKWVRAQSAPEDFLTFSALLGYHPSVVASWMAGDAIPQDGEVMSIASLLNVKVYDILELPHPDEDLFRIFKSISHITGDFRYRLACALLDVESEMHERGIDSNSPEAGDIFKRAFERWRFPSTTIEEEKQMIASLLSE